MCLSTRKLLFSTFLNYFCYKDFYFTRLKKIIYNNIIEKLLMHWKKNVL